MPRRKQRPKPVSEARQLQKAPTKAPLPAELGELPATYQAIQDYFLSFGEAPPDLFTLRDETMRRIGKATGRPLLCYVGRTQNVPTGIPAYIEDGDLTGFADLCRTVEGDSADIFVMSNGGVAEATERIVRLLRERFTHLRFVVPANAFSAATLLCFSGEQIVMDITGTLGPIDPQINGVPARAIIRGFEEVEKRLKEEGPGALTAYVPLLSKYDLHTLEICKSAEELSKELARTWLQNFMLKCAEGDPRLDQIVEFFSNYDLHKSHARSIDRKTARDLGVEVVPLEEFDGPPELVRSLYNQYVLFFDKTDFFKLYENAHGVHWGRRAQTVTLQIPVPPGGIPMPQPGPGHPSG